MELVRRKEAASVLQRQSEDEAEAANRSATAVSSLVEEVCSVIVAGGDLAAIDSRIADLIADGVIGFKDRKKALVEGWQRAVVRMLEDNLLSSLEEEGLMKAMDRFLITRADVEGDGSYARIALASTLRRIANGEPGIKVDLEPGFPINFQAGENPIWSFGRTEYYEDRARRKFEGRSRGISVRVVSGVYVRLGAFSGEPVITSESVHVDTGILVLGSRNLYFVGPSKSLRVPYAKIVSLTRYSDGVGLHREAASAKPQAFKTGDGWAAYNLLAALCRGQKDAA
jgi:hypothetical protein